MPVPRPENIGDIYLIRDYPATGMQEYGVAYKDSSGAKLGHTWVLLTQDGDLHWWSKKRQRWVIGADDEEQTLVRRNEWPKETP